MIKDILPKEYFDGAIDANLCAIDDRLHLLALRQRVQLALEQLSRGQVATGRDTLQQALIDCRDRPPEAA